MQSCPVTADLNRYLAQQETDQAFTEIFNERMDALVEELIAKDGEFDKLHPHHLSEAIGEALCDDKGEFVHQLADCMQRGAADELLKLIEKETTKYWSGHVREHRKASLTREIEQQFADAEAERRHIRRYGYLPDGY